MSDSDDDRPISELIKKRMPTFKAAPTTRDKDKQDDPPAKKSKSDANTKVKNEKKDDREKDKAKKPSSSSSGSNPNRSMAFYEDTDKGKLVQCLLVRWWYALEWPKADEIGQPPEGYESLEGFPGVFISTKVRLQRFFSYVLFV